MVEMRETRTSSAEPPAARSIILDEIGRGTSTYDGLAIAWAVAEHLHDVIGARALFATHYHELTSLSADRPRVVNVSVAVHERGGDIRFLRKVVAGGASRSYGIEVAKLAGLPRTVVGRARELLAELEQGSPDPPPRPLGGAHAPGHPCAHPVGGGAGAGRDRPGPHDPAAGVASAGGAQGLDDPPTERTGRARPRPANITGVSRFNAKTLVLLVSSLLVPAAAQAAREAPKSPRPWPSPRPTLAR